MKAKVCKVCFLLIGATAFLAPACALAQGAIAGLDTNGAVLQINHKSGALTPTTEEAINSFSLGGTARNANKLYYVAEPSGSSENAIYTAVLPAATLSHVALDRDDAVRALFFKGKKLYGIFYNGDAGTAGLYRINPVTGVTTLVLDLSDLNVEPIAGALTEFGKFYYMLSKPESDSGQRQLLRFKLKAGSAQLFSVVDSSGNPVLCEKLKPNISKGNFVCLASAASETQVNVCKLSVRGKAACLATLANVLRVGSGHTMLTQDQKNYYAFVYAPGEPDNQHLIKFTSKGVLKSNLTLETIMIGAHFKTETPSS